MSFILKNVVPWGRSFDEYVAMFALTEKDLTQKILGCGDGPAGFNAELTRRGGRVVSADPLYQFSAEAIASRIAETREEVLEQTRGNRDEFVWTRIKTVEELGRVRMAAMSRFLADYPKGQGRYIASRLPCLPFKDNEFDIALCSHLLFLYSEQYPLGFHIQSVKELLRVAPEVRVFPLLELGAKRSRHLDAVRQNLEKEKYVCQVEPVSYEFQKGGNEMLRIRSCGSVPR